MSTIVVGNSDHVFVFLFSVIFQEFGKMMFNPTQTNRQVYNNQWLFHLLAVV